MAFSLISTVLLMSGPHWYCVYVNHFCR